MRFALSDDQAAFAAAARDVFAGGDTTWDAVCEMGLPSMLAEGFGEVAFVAVLEEAGRAAVALPVLEAPVVAPVAGDDGSVTTTDLGGGVVPFATCAERFVLDTGDGLAVAEAGEVDVEPVDTVDRSRRAGRVRARTSSPVGGAAERELAFHRGTVGAAASLCGLGQRMLDLTVAYVRDRRQFGVPVGSFQAVRHHLADAALALEFARPAVWRAGWSLEQDTADRERDVSMAKALASDAATLVARKALQCHGAIGYTTEYELHRYLKRSWALARSWGDPGWHRDRVGRAIGV